MADRNGGPAPRENGEAREGSETLDARSAPDDAGEAPAAAEHLARQGRVRVATPPRSVSDRLTIYVVRGTFVVVMAGVGLQGAKTFSLMAGVPSSYYLTGSLVGILAAVLLIVVEALFARSPIRTIAAISFGLLMGLVLSAVFQHVVQMIVQAVVPVTPDLDPERQATFFSFLNLLTTCLFCYFGIALLLGTKDDFKFIIPYVEFRKQVKSHMPLILDTSVFIDGRFQGLLATGMLDQRLEVPRFVLDELQAIADSADRAMRERGRRGMDILHDVERQYWVDVIDLALDAGEQVDAALIRLAALHEGKLLTTDYNLTKRARLQGVGVLNVNDIASALRPTLVAGECFRVRLLRAGDEARQGVGFLRDGTMVVVEGARDRVGEEVMVEVTSSIQTSAGKMAFAKLRGAAKGKSKR